MGTPNNEKNWQRTSKLKKFLKKPKNKTAKKQYFKELVQNLRKGPEIAERLVKNELETFSKILDFADISKKLDLELLELLLDALKDTITKEEYKCESIETFYALARHNIITILFKMLIVLKEKILAQYKHVHFQLFFSILGLFNLRLSYKRIQKLLRNTEGFETVSQQRFWAPIYFSPKIYNAVKVYLLWFFLRISRQNSFTEKFVEKYITVAREFISIREDKEQIVGQKLVMSISQIILESEQREFFLNLVSDLPDKSTLIASESEVENMKSDHV